MTIKRENKKEKIIVFTTNFNDYDEVKPIFPDFNVQYIAITDQKEDYWHYGWDNIRQKKPRGVTNPRKLSRYYKINSHLLPPHDYSIYLDASLKLNFPPSFFVPMLGYYDIAICPHPNDNYLYEHYNTCVKFELDDPDIMKKQLDKYLKQGMPFNFGLTENCFIIRRNTPAIKKLNTLWWKEYKKGSQRDQLSLPYALWKTDTKVTYLPFNMRDSIFAEGWGQHLKDRRYK